MEKPHERKISDSYKSLNGKWPEKNQRVINNPVTQKKVIIMYNLYNSNSCTHINPVAAAYDSILGGSEVSGGDQTMEGAALDGHGGCGESPMPQVKPMVEIEDHHGL